MSNVFKDNLDAVLLQCTGRTSDQMSVYELKKWAREHKDIWAENMVLATTYGATEDQIRSQLVANAYTWIKDPPIPYSQDKKLRQTTHADCSSLVQRIYEQTIPQIKADGSLRACAADQGLFCHNMNVFLDKNTVTGDFVTAFMSVLKPGDILFWAWESPEAQNGRYMEIDHVGMVLEASAGDAKIIEARKKGVVIQMLSEREPNKVVLVGQPVRLFTGEEIEAVSATAPELIQSLDVYGVISPTELIYDVSLNNGELYKYFYCSCSYCRSSSVADMTGMPREVGHMAMSPMSQIAYTLSEERESAVGDETGTVMSIDGKLYKCVDYGEGRFALSLDTIGLYTEDNGEYTSKIVWSDRVSTDGIDPGESFISDHIDAINRTYAHQIRTSCCTEDYRVLPIDPENLLTAQFDTYRHSGNPNNEYVITGG